MRLVSVSAGLLVAGILSAQDLPFEPTAQATGYVARCPGLYIHVDAGGADLVTARAAFAVRLVGASAGDLAAEHLLPGQSHYLLGRERARWRQGVPHFARVRHAAAWPGIDVVWYGSNGVLEYDLVVAPGADLGQARVRFPGAKVAAEPDGALAIAAAGGRLQQRAPIGYQVVGGVRRSVPIEVVQLGADAIAFRAGPHDATRPLVIDPQLAYGTYLGGTGADAVHAIARDPAGNLYLTGLTTSANFPVVMPFQPAPNGLYDMFVTKIDPTGSTILYSTFLGGGSGGFGTDEWAVALAVDAQGRVVVLGRTETTDFPVHNAHQATLAGAVDAVVFKLDTNGAQLLWSTYFGGTGNEIDRDNRIGAIEGGVVLDPSGDVFVAGTTWSTDLPVRNARQPMSGGGSDLFTARFDAGGVLLYASYLGGSGFDTIGSARDAGQGTALLSGSTSGGFPTTPGVYDRTGRPGFVLRQDVASQAFVWSTTFPVGVADATVDAAGDVYLVGGGNGVPTTMGAHQVDHGGSFDGHGLQSFLTKLDANATRLVYSTYYGSPSADETLTAVAVDAFGHAYAVGTTSQHFGSPTQSAFVLKLDPTGSTVVYATDVSGRNSSGNDVLLRGPGDVYVAGETWATSNFATAGAVQTIHGGNLDGFLARIEDHAVAIRAFKMPTDRLPGLESLVGTVTLDGIAPASGATVTFTSSAPAIVPAPAPVVIPAGSTTALVPVHATRVSTTHQVVLTAMWSGNQATVSLRVWPGPAYRALPIVVPTALNGRSYGLDVNAFGVVTGTDEYQFFTFDGQTLQVHGSGEGHGINEAAQVAGGTGAEAFRWSPATGVQRLGALQPGMFSIGYDIDPRGRVVGFSDFDSGTVLGQRAFLWVEGLGMRNLGTLGGESSEAHGINRHGAITGSAAVAGAATRPFLWTETGGMRNLGALPGFAYASGLAINDASEVAGIALSPGLRAFRWTPAGGMLDLGVLGGDRNSGARGINSFGWVVGWSSPGEANGGRAMRWIDGTMQALHDELSAVDAFLWDFVNAEAINDAGQITGSGDYRGARLAETAFRLDPELQRPYGRGCAGLDAKVTALAGSGTPAPSNRITWLVAGRPGAPAVLLLGAAAVQVPLPGGCELLVQAPHVVLPSFVLDADGRGSLPLTVPPNTPVASVFVQAICLDAAGGNGLYTASNGLEVRVR